MAATNHAKASAYVNEYRRLLDTIDTTGIDAVTRAIVDAWTDDRRVFVYGNGGSALSASHWALDLVKTAAVPGLRRLRAMSLSEGIGHITAIGNDYSFEDIFRYQLESFGATGDVAVAISCSGSSPNVLAATRWATDHQLQVITLTGFDGGELRSMGSLAIHVPSQNYGVTEDIHMSVGHMVAQGLRDYLERAKSASA